MVYLLLLGLFWTNFFQPSIPTHVKAGLFLTYALVNYQLANGINMVLDGVPLRLGLEHQVGQPNQIFSKNQQKLKFFFIDVFDRPMLW